MNSLIIFAALTWILAFTLIVRFSRNKYKFGEYEAIQERVAVKNWITQGGRVAYYRLAVASSALITMLVAVVVKVVFY